MDADTLIATPLSWLKSEIDRSLGLARAALARALNQPQERSAALSECEQPVRHIRGALQMLNLEGATCFCRALEQALCICVDTPARLNHVSAAVMDRALFALSQFLDDLAKGEADVPLKLFPMYRELGELSDRADVAENELFYPDVSLVPPRARAAELLQAEQLERYVVAWRAQFQRGLLAWLKQPDDVRALHAMSGGLDALDQIGTQLAAPPGLWWVAGGVVDLLLHADTQTDRASLKPLLGRTERLMGAVVSGALNDAGGLMREMLYPLALAAPVCPRVSDIKTFYKLDAQLPEFCLSGTLEYDVSALAPLLDDMRTRLAAMEDAWARYTAGSGEALAQLRTHAGGLKAIARDLGHYRLVRLLDIVMLIASRLPESYPASNEVLALEMAAALLFMEGMLDHFTSPPADIDQQVAVMVGWLLDAVKPRGLPALGTGAPRDDITQRQQYTEIRAQVAREILSNLRHVEQTVDEIARDPALRDRIAILDAPVRQIAGALKMLGLSRANGVLSACLHLMKLSVSDDPGLTRASLEWVADGLTCLGFYLDNVRHGEVPNEEILLGFVQRLSRDDAHPAGSTGWIPASDEHPAEPLQDGGTARYEPVRAQAEESSAGSAHDDTDDALELRAVYLAEARAILARLASLLEQLRTEPDDMHTLVEVRRAFHTLKGGARVVGLEAEGTLAWEVEQTLNAFLHAQAAASVELVVLAAEAGDALAASVHALERGLQSETAPYAKIAELAAALRAPEAADDVAVELRAQDGGEIGLPQTSALDLSAQCPPAALAFGACANEALAGGESADPGRVEIAIGDVRLSPTLFGIYRRESDELLDSLRVELEQLRLDPAAPISQALLRAAHTLRSTAGTLGFEPIANLAGAFEDALHERAKDALPGASVVILEAALASLQTMFYDIRSQRTPSFDADTETLLRELAAEPAAARDTNASAGAALQAAEAEAATAAGVRLDVRLLQLFLDEACELLPLILRSLSNWRRFPDASEPAREMARALHTLKGGARMAGAMDIGEATHALESRVGMAIEGGGQDDSFFSAVQAELDHVARAIDVLNASAAGTPLVAALPARTRDETTILPPEPQQAAPALRVDAHVLDRLVDQAGEISSARMRIEGSHDGVRQSLHDLTEAVARLRAQLRETQVQADSQVQSHLNEQGTAERGFDPLELDRYTRLQELTRMMAESLHDVQMIQQALLASSTETEAALALQGRVARDLQHELVELKSVPFGSLSERLQRTVRQTARELERDAELHIEGETIGLERSMLQRLAAPLEHMLRNAIAHGIESELQRSTLGKPGVGRILLAVQQHGFEAVLTLADDGAGLDASRIREEAIGLGLLAPAADTCEAELFQLIFAPGLSTATHLTESSGRGVGLDVVRTEIAALGGSIEVASAPGEGTSFRIRLPLSLAAAQVLLLRAAGSTYAVPAGLVESVEELSPAQLEQAYAEGMLPFGADQYPLYRLPRLLNKDEGAAELKRTNTVLLLRSHQQKIAVHVDQVLRNQEAVLKPLGPQLARVPGLAGATVLGNDQIVLVIDPLQWCASARPARIHSGLAAARNAALHADPAHLLIVDDSLTVRRLTSRLLGRAGYEVSTAKDGLEALQQIQRVLPDLIVIDLEMPRMDGFDLTRELRADSRTAAVPIVIVTSRLADKHQRRALEMGADAFFGKPYPEDELLACVAELLGRRAAERAA